MVVQGDSLARVPTAQPLGMRQGNTMNLNEIIDATATDRAIAPVQTNNHTTEVINRFGRGLPFRGLLKNVQGLHPSQIPAASGLDWKTVTLPVSAVGKRESRVINGYKALVRSDNGETLTIASQAFKAHQNSEILGDMLTTAEIGDAEIVMAGALDGGRRVVAVAKMNGEFTLPNVTAVPVKAGDLTALFAVISGGHEVGTPYKIRGLAFRLWCANGAFFTTGSTASFSVTHRLNLSEHRAQIAATYEAIRNEFGQYGANAHRLQSTPMERNQSRLLVAELLAPGIANRMQEAMPTLSRADLYEHMSTRPGGMFLNEMLKAHEDTPGFARTGRNLLDAIVNQEGSNGANLWSGFNGVTWYVDHVRGRNPESGVNAAMFGEGARLKESALSTALSFVR